MEAGAMDSLALVELLVHLEEELDIQIALDDVDLDSFRSISRIAEFVGRSQARRNGNGNGNGHQKRP